MKMFFMSFLILFSVACSHHHNKPKHHHHQFNKQCAYEVSQNHLDVKGNPEISLEHDGETYYFSSVENKKKFEEHLDENIQKSKQNWTRGAGIK